MALNRITVFFEQQENGWSESIHTQNTGLPILIGNANDYVNARLACLTPQASITHVRISDDLIFRDIVLDPFPLPLPGGWKGSAVAEAPWVAIDLRLSATLTVQRSLFFRGIPAGQLNGNRYTPTAAFGTAFSAFVNFIIGAPWAIKNKDRTQLKQPIFSITPGGLVTLSAPLPGVVDLATVQILGIPRSVVPKRTYTVINTVSNTSFQLRGWNAGQITQQGYLRLVNFILLPITSAATNNVTERRTGRPFGVLRGRRAIVR